MIRNSLLLLSTLLVLAIPVGLLPGCSNPATNTVIIGVTSDYRAGVDLQTLGVEMSVDGAVIFTETMLLGTSAGKTSFPTELSFDDVEPGQRLAVTLRGYAGEDLRVVRHLETIAQPAPTRLLRVHLEQECSINNPDGSSQPDAPLCNETTETCIAGSCAAAEVPSDEQEDYSPGWADTFGDVCRPLGADAPIVMVGLGQGDYFSTEDYAEAQVEAGPQGGHHIWVAARLKNLHQSGSITSVGGEVPSLGLSISPLKVIFTLEPDEGGFCKLYGLRFQIDTDVGADQIGTLLGEELKVIVTVTDVADNVGTGELWVTLSDDII